MSVIADPEEMDDFANTLRSFCEAIQSELAQLNAGFSSLSNSWQDIKQQEFAEMLGELNNQINQFTEVSEENVLYLHQQAERLREYLQA